MKMQSIGKIYATPMEKCAGLLAELFFGRNPAVYYVNPRISFMAKRQKSSDAVPRPFPLRSIYFSYWFLWAYLIICYIPK